MTEEQIVELQQENADWLVGYGLLSSEAYNLRLALKAMLDAFVLDSGEVTKMEAVSKALNALEGKKDRQ